MHKFSYFFGLVLLSLFACEPATSTTTEAAEPAEVLPTAEEGRQAIEQLVRDAFDEVWSACDTTALDRLHTTDFVLLEHGEVWNNDTIKNYQIGEAVRTAEQGYERQNSFEFIETVADGKTVWTAYHNHAKWVKDDEVLFTGQWLESAVAILTEDGWKLKMLHSTRVPRNE